MNFLPYIYSAASAAAEMYGQNKANKQNIKLAREQMSFQERMSNTAYQRSISDMRAAGVNPVLAFQGGGASSPTGSTAKVDSVVGKAASTALESRRMMAELDNLAVQNRLLKQQTDESAARTMSTIDRNEPDKVKADLIRAARNSMKDVNLPPHSAGTATRKSSGKSRNFDEWRKWMKRK